MINNLSVCIFHRTHTHSGKVKIACIDNGFQDLKADECEPALSANTLFCSFASLLPAFYKADVTQKAGSPGVQIGRTLTIRTILSEFSSSGCPNKALRLSNEGHRT